MNLTNILPIALFIANMMSFSILLVTGSSSSSSICGDPNDACMTNYADCEKLLQDGCIEIAILESCPLQFRCRKQSSTMTISKKKSGVYSNYCFINISINYIITLRDLAEERTCSSDNVETFWNVRATSFRSARREYR